MYYVNPKHIQQEAELITKQMMVTILTIPSAQRSSRDHELVYKFFHNNHFLNEIQRTKSLNARIKCVAALQIKDKKPEPTAAAIVSKFKIEREEETKIYYDYYYITIPINQLEDIKSANEKYLRQNMDSLRKFSLLQQMKYQQLLHLAYYLDECIFKYKEYVFREGEQSLYLYLVVEGEFHYIKSMQEMEQEGQKVKKKKSKHQRYENSQINPNKLKKSKSVEYKVGIIEGGLGQAMGEQQLLCRDKRKYSMICMSTQNKVLRIHRDYYLNIMRGNETKMNWILRENKRKMEFKRQKLDKMVTTKNNYKVYMKAMEEKESKSPKQSNQNLLSQISQNYQSQTPEVDETNVLHTSNKSQEANKKLIKNLSKSKLPKHNKTVVSPPKSQEEQEKVEEEDEQEDEQEFQITQLPGIQRKSTEKKGMKNNAHSVHITEASHPDSFLPQISQTKPSKHQSFDAKIAKSWSVARPNIELKKMRGKYAGMIDSNLLIEEKEFILAQKTPKNLRNDIFPMQPPKRKDPILYQYQKVRPNKGQLREMRSAVHSKNYMQSLLVDALKKAGYQKKAQEETEPLHPTFELKKKVKVIKEKNKKQILTDTLLQSSPFDQYYFRQI